MGCDIHTYVEFSDFITRDGEPHWKSFTRNGGSRNYVMFGVLAGVRCPEFKLFEPKGMPDGQLSYDTNGDYWCMVAPADHPEWAEDDDWISIEQAERWVENGSRVAGDRDPDGRLRKVSGPDWHSHSWLTANELAAALEHYAKLAPQHLENGTVPAEWVAMLAAMRAFENCGARARLVFWFDN